MNPLRNKARRPNPSHQQRTLDQLQRDIGIPAEALQAGVRPTRAQVRGPRGRRAFVLDVRRLQILGVLRDSTFGQLVWSIGESAAASVLYSYRSQVLRLFEFTSEGALRELGTDIHVVWLHAYAGSGFRPWLLCPNQQEDGICGRRALKLYLVEEEERVACRRCANNWRHLRQIQLSSASAHQLGA